VGVKYGIVSLEWCCRIITMKNSPTYFQPQKSRIYGWYLLSTHLFALICVSSVTSFFLFPVFFLCVTISFLIYFCRAPKIISLQYDQKRKWILELTDHSIERAELLSSSVMMRYFLILHFKALDSGIKRTSLLFSDSFSPLDFQALRRCVKMGFL